MGLILAGNILLQTSGGTSSPPSTGGSPGGANTQIQFNDAGGFNGSVNFTINKTTGVVNFAYPPTIGGFAISTTEGTVTSISLSGGSTGLTTSGGPITSSGTITLDGTLAIANGGTGPQRFDRNRDRCNINRRPICEL